MEETLVVRLSLSVFAHIVGHRLQLGPVLSRNSAVGESQRLVGCYGLLQEPERLIRVEVFDHGDPSQLEPLLEHLSGARLRPLSLVA